MKLGFNLLLWTTHVVDEHLPILDRLKATGYDGVEVPLFEGEVGHYAGLGRTLKEAGLGATTVTVRVGATAVRPSASVTVRFTACAGGTANRKPFPTRARDGSLRIRAFSKKPPCHPTTYPPE